MLLSPWRFKGRKYSVSHAMSSFLYFSVRSCATGKLIKGRSSLAVILFHFLSKQNQEYHRSNIRCDLESKKKGRKVSLAMNILPVLYSQHEKEITKCVVKCSKLELLHAMCEWRQPLITLRAATQTLLIHFS